MFKESWVANFELQYVIYISKKVVSTFWPEELIIYNPKSNFNFLSNLDFFFLYMWFGGH